MAEDRVVTLIEGLTRTVEEDRKERKEDTRVLQASIKEVADKTAAMEVTLSGFTLRQDFHEREDERQHKDANRRLASLEKKSETTTSPSATATGTIATGSALGGVGLFEGLRMLLEYLGIGGGST